MRSSILFRVVICTSIALSIALIFNEITYVFLRSEETRAPGTIELTIPPGTAAQITRGQDNPTIPSEMTFVVGDTLLVNNQDVVDHQLGPMYIPAGSSASLTFDAVQNYAYACSFQTGRYLGMEVHEPLTAGTRVLGAFFAGLPLGALLTLYSLVAWPVKKSPASQKSPKSTSFEQ